MSVVEAILLGILQGLTEFLPVSSSGHIELGKAILGVDRADNLLFSLIVHGATVLSTIIVFRKDIAQLFRGLLQFEWNKETKFVVLLLVSAIPLAVVGLIFQDQINQLFSGNLVLVGLMLIVTALLLQLTRLEKANKTALSYKSALMIGLAQVLAVMPGISRSGATISTALALGIDRAEAARFSFLMVLLPILGANTIECFHLAGSANSAQVSTSALFAGFLAAFICGLLACKWMIALVKNGKIIYFSIYCFVVGAIAIFAALNQ